MFALSLAGRLVFGLVVLCLAGLALILALPPGSGAAREKAPGAQAGTLDLSNWDFAKGGSVSLAGEWHYFDARWASDVEGATPATKVVPGRTSSFDAEAVARAHGFATYALTLRLPRTAPEPLAIETGYFYSAYRVYANGKLITQSGVPSATADGESPRVYSKFALLPAGVDTIELRYEVSNHLRSFRGSLSAPRVGLESAIAGDRNWVAALSLLLVGAMLFGASYHFVVVILSKENQTSLWFGVFAALLAVRTLTIAPLADHVVPFVGQDWVWRIDFAATTLLIPTAYWFFALNFRQHVSRKLAVPLSLYCGAVAVISIVFGADVGGLALKTCQVVAPIVIIYLTQAIARAAWSGEPGGWLAFVGWLFSAGTSLHDIMLDHNIVSGISLIPFGFVTFFLCLSGTLVARYSDAFRRSEQMSRHMQTRAVDLEAAVAERTRELSGTIEELTRSQAELERARSAAVSANVAKSRFLAMMSHELRTPLNSILGFSDIIRGETLGPIGDGRYGEYAAHIHDSGTHLLHLIGDVLDISRIEAGKVELKLETLDLTEICESAVRHAATRERRAADAVTMRVESELPTVKADQRAVTQMVINLLSNALKFTPAEGQITLALRRRADGGVTIEVADNGAGMDAADIPKALALFSQLDDSLARRHEGTGLGLPIVKSLIELHGGQLSLVSEKGRGTTARLDFPPDASAGSATQAA
jgi:signal transduction histidine kinase